jgi:hypothetical protein
VIHYIYVAHVVVDARYYIHEFHYWKCLPLFQEEAKKTFLGFEFPFGSFAYSRLLESMKY